MSSYQSRINRVLDYIERNLDRDLSLPELADQAYFSPYHFLRIFHSHTGERPFEYLQRLRLEKAAVLLSSRPDRRILDIAMDCGFSNAPAFSRAFKQKFDTSPSDWRRQHPSISNFSTVGSNAHQDDSSWTPYIEYHQGAQIWRMKKGDEERRVDVRDMPSMELAYMRYTGPYQGDGRLFQRLWNQAYSAAGARDLIDGQNTFLSIYHDNPDLTDDAKLRVTLAISIAKEFAGDDVLSTMHLKGGKTAMARFRLNSGEYQDAWNWVYRHWLPVSGYFPDDRPSFELYPPEEQKSEDGRYPVVICIPVTPAS
jgi:AraC family transcriptional regulator